MTTVDPNVIYLVEKAELLGENAFNLMLNAQLFSSCLSLILFIIGVVLYILILKYVHDYALRNSKYSFDPVPLCLTSSCITVPVIAVIMYSIYEIIMIVMCPEYMAAMNLISIIRL